MRRGIDRALYMDELYKRTPWEYIGELVRGECGEVRKGENTRYITAESVSIPIDPLCPYCRGDLELSVRKFKSCPFFFTRVPPLGARDLGLKDEVVFIVASTLAQCSNCRARYEVENVLRLAPQETESTWPSSFVEYLLTHFWADLVSLKETHNPAELSQAREKLQQRSSWTIEDFPVRAGDIVNRADGGLVFTRWEALDFHPIPSVFV